MFRRNQSDDVTEINPIRYATTLCLFGRTRNGYVAAHLNILSSAWESSATNGYVVVPEHFGQNEEPVIRNEERTRKKSELFSQQ